jgi:hypothetical protein
VGFVVRPRPWPARLVPLRCRDAASIGDRARAGARAISALVSPKSGRGLELCDADAIPHVPSSIRSWLGDSRGRWERDTFVVDTTNFTDKTSFCGSGPNLHLIERFRRVDARTLHYEYTVDDPDTFTRPWTAVLPMTKTDQRIYEYACHEGNYALPDILRGARFQERALAK